MKESTFVLLLLLLLLWSTLETVNAEENNTQKDFPASTATLGLLVEKPYLSGIRIEHETKKDDDTFVGYKSDGVSVVHPDVTVRVVLFGTWLDQITDIAFTLKNCSDVPRFLSYDQFAFDTHLDRRIVLATAFPEAHEDYKVCMRYKIKGKAGEEDKLSDYIQIDDATTQISTELPPPTYYLPFFLQIAVILFLVVLSGFFSGINLGLMSLQPRELELIIKSGSETEARHAEAILPIRRSGNFLLCSQLISNVVVNSAISILFDDMTSGVFALIISSFAIVVFAEIIPQSICVKKGLAVGAYTVGISRFFMILTCPLSWPISKILDCIVGEEVTVYSRKRLMEMMIMAKPTDGGRYAEELEMALGAMQLSEKKVGDVMTQINVSLLSLCRYNSTYKCKVKLRSSAPQENVPYVVISFLQGCLVDVFMLANSTVLDARTVAKIMGKGFTRILVYCEDRNNIVALLNVKDLALIDPDQNFTVKTVCRYNEHPVRFVTDDTPLRTMLDEFKKGAYHLAMVRQDVRKDENNSDKQLVGVITLEDILEEILQAEIIDETDSVTDNVHRARRLNAQARKLTGILRTESEKTASISMQLRMATVQWLVANQRAFHSDLIGQNILERLVRHNVHQINFSNRSRFAALYSKDQLSERFILILEGRVEVTIGKHEMKFEAGPWHCFGEEMLRKLIKIAPKLACDINTTDTGDSTDLSLKKESKSGRRQAAFVPDFTAVAHDECTYLEIAAVTYLRAYHATLMGNKSERNLLNSADSKKSSNSAINEHEEQWSDNDTELGSLQDSSSKESSNNTEQDDETTAKANKKNNETIPVIVNGIEREISISDTDEDGLFMPSVQQNE